ncbi:MAG: transcriptional repressor LexA [Candidatus Omnitrophota bacterium]
MKIIQDLTTRQTAVLRFLQQKISQEGRPPTIREICKHFGFKSTGTARDYLSTLSKKGHIKLKPKEARSIELSRPLMFRIPILGRITAGLPDLALEEMDGYLHLDEFLPQADRQIFGLKITGESMKNKGIHDGDIALVRRQRTADSGDIVAALIENEATIKILQRQKSKFVLAPAHETYGIIEKPFAILGKVIAVVKKF